jgi:hypothetical protein
VGARASAKPIESVFGILEKTIFSTCNAASKIGSRPKSNEAIAGSAGK